MRARLIHANVVIAARQFNRQFNPSIFSQRWLG